MMWTESRTDELICRWQLGESATRISQHLNCSRGAVIGKLDRLGFLRKRYAYEPASVMPRPVTLPKIKFQDDVPI